MEIPTGGEWARFSQSKHARRMHGMPWGEVKKECVRDCRISLVRRTRLVSFKGTCELEDCNFLFTQVHVPGKKGTKFSTAARVRMLF